MPKKLIGLSLSLCVQDIIGGERDEVDVLKIVTGTRAATDEEWEQLLTDYAHHYWGEDPDRAVDLANRLRKEGRIEQPRLIAGTAPTWGREGYWVRNEKEIQYQLVDE